MERVWAPWRTAYINEPKKKGCIFCFAVTQDMDLTLYHGALCTVLLNRYPYTNGHLLVSPKRHVGLLEDLTVEEGAAIMAAVTESVRILKQVMNPQGFGAGIEEHLHVHIVPRWQGDANFMTVVGDVRVISEDLETTFAKLKAHFRTMVAHT
jgi:ATP adenylyltransferase